MREPGRPTRLVLVDAVPLLPGYTWPREIQWWRRGLLGELVMGSTTRGMLARQLRKASTRPETAWSEARVRAVWDQFDQGTQRALLRLHRAADEAWLAEAGRELDRVDAPTLIVWGDADPWFPPRFADAYGRRLSNATVEHISAAGHWPWLDQPDTLDLVARFLAGQ
jgi:pimeloyl-ACP methyl ester carboxylesterase